MMTATEPTGRRSACKVRLATCSINAGKPRKSTFQPGIRAGRYPFRPRPTESTISVTVLGHVGVERGPRVRHRTGRPGAGAGVRVGARWPGSAAARRVAELLATWFAPLADPGVLQPASHRCGQGAGDRCCQDGPARPPAAAARRSHDLSHAADLTWQPAGAREHTADTASGWSRFARIRPAPPGPTPAATAAGHGCPHVAGRTGLSRPQCVPVGGHLATVPFVRRLPAVPCRWRRSSCWRSSSCWPVRAWTAVRPVPRRVRRRPASWQP